MNLYEVQLLKISKDEIKCKNKKETINIKIKNIINFEKFKEILVRGIIVNFYEEFKKFYIYDLLKPEPNKDIYHEFIRSINEKADLHSTKKAQFESFLENMQIYKNNLITVSEKHKEYNRYINHILTYYEKFNKLYLKKFNNFEINLRNIKKIYEGKYYCIIFDLLKKIWLKNFLDSYKRRILEEEKSYFTENEKYRNYCDNNKIKKKEKNFNKDIYSKNPIYINNEEFLKHILQYFNNSTEELYNVIDNRLNKEYIDNESIELNINCNNLGNSLSLKKLKMFLNKNNSKEREEILYNVFKEDLFSAFNDYNNNNNSKKKDPNSEFTICMEDFIIKYTILYCKYEINLNKIITSYEYIKEIIEVMNKYNRYNIENKVLTFIEKYIKQEDQVIYKLAYDINNDLKKKSWLPIVNYNFRTKILNFLEKKKYIKIIDNYFTLYPYFRCEYNIIDFVKKFIMETDNIILYNKIKNDIKLTPKQAKFFNDFIQTHVRIGILEGNAGTGKTHTASLIMKNLYHNEIPFIVLAPTGKAIKNISTNFEEKIKSNHNNIDKNKSSDYYDFCTIDKFLHSSKCNKKNFKVLIIEEAGMISTEKLSDFIDKIKYCKNIRKILLLGNNKQLPPIEKGEPYNFLQEWAKKEDNMIFEELTDIMRQKNKEIPTAANLISQCEDAQFFDLIKDCKTIKLIDVSEKKNEKKKKKKIKKILKKDKFYDDTIILNQRKKNCADDNSIVQKITNNNESIDYKNSFLINNKIIFTQNIYNTDGESIVMNGEMAIITDMTVLSEKIEIKLKINNNDNNSLNEMKLPLTKKNLTNDFEEYYKFVIKNEFYYVRKDECPYKFQLGWALTVHKAQGSESKHVILHLDGSCDKRLLNTALTRAKKSITIYSTHNILKNIINKPTINNIEKFNYILKNFDNILNKKKKIIYINIYKYIKKYKHNVLKKTMYFKKEYIFNEDQKKKIMNKWKANNNDGILSLSTGTLIIDDMTRYLEN